MGIRQALSVGGALLCAVVTGCAYLVGSDGDFTRVEKVCSAAVDCDDGDLCTSDACKSGLCDNQPLSDGFSPPHENDCAFEICVGGELSPFVRAELSSCATPDGQEGYCEGGACKRDCDGELDCGKLTPLPPCQRYACELGRCVTHLELEGQACLRDEGASGGGKCDDGGHCVECNHDADCAAGGAGCATRICSADRTCVFLPSGQDDPSAPASPSDCIRLLCDGNGSSKTFFDPREKPEDDGEFCTDERCIDGVPSHPPKTGVSCDAGVGIKAQCSDKGTCLRVNGQPCEKKDDCLSNNCAGMKCVP